MDRFRPRRAVSPPTRGWTFDYEIAALVRNRRSSGFPAHAGMDRKTVSPPTRGWTERCYPTVRRSTACSGFPRPRGDGPDLHAGEPGSAGVSPPTRGWTAVRMPLSFVKRGFPAHAGMDPCCTTEASERLWFPRPRGDGPDACASPMQTVMVSPPTRGWTLHKYRDYLSGEGFPAHAGMDLLGFGAAGRGRRFPRPRGDGPGLSRETPAGIRVSPPTRGWTRFTERIQEQERGFPAHAGMDPSTLPSSNTGARFPRPRGDGPPAGDSRCVHRVVSPPTRGWTSDQQSIWTRSAGFPAHAGMDPTRTASGYPPTGFPRPRGDGPP